MMPNPDIQTVGAAPTAARFHIGATHSPGWIRFVLWSGVMVASFGFVLIAASQNRPVFPVAGLALSPPKNESRADTYKATAKLADLASFQRRGNSLVGEVTTREGAVMRLVFDARTHTLIGFRVLDALPNRPGEPEAARGCVDQSTATLPLPPSPAAAAPPLPKAASPAN